MEHKYNATLEAVKVDDWVLSFPTLLFIHILRKSEAYVAENIELTVYTSEVDFVAAVSGELPLPLASTLPPVDNINIEP